MLQLAREFDDGRTSPTVAVEGDASVLLLVGGDGAVGVCREEGEDATMRLVHMAIFEDFHIDSGGILLAQTVCELDHRMDAVVAADEASHKTDHNGRRPGGIGALRCGCRGCVLCLRASGDRCEREQNA